MRRKGAWQQRRQKWKQCGAAWMLSWRSCAPTPAETARLQHSPTMLRCACDLVGGNVLSCIAPLSIMRSVQGLHMSLQSACLMEAF